VARLGCRTFQPIFCCVFPACPSFSLLVVAKLIFVPFILLCRPFPLPDCSMSVNPSAVCPLAPRQPVSVRQFQGTFGRTLFFFMLLLVHCVPVLLPHRASPMVEVPVFCSHQENQLVLLPPLLRARLLLVFPLGPFFKSLPSLFQARRFMLVFDFSYPEPAFFSRGQGCRLTAESCSSCGPTGLGGLYGDSPGPMSISRIRSPPPWVLWLLVVPRNSMICCFSFSARDCFLCRGQSAFSVGKSFLRFFH